MSDSKPYDSAFTFKDDMSVREVFADGVHSVLVSGTVATFTLTASRPDDIRPGHKGPPKEQKVTVARLAIPVNTFAELYNKMDQIMRALEAQGLVKRDGGAVKGTLQ